MYSVLRSSPSYSVAAVDEAASHQSFSWAFRRYGVIHTIIIIIIISAIKIIIIIIIRIRIISKWSEVLALLAQSHR